MHLYLKIEEYIKNLIENGALNEGDCIPIETDLSIQFNVSRPTVRQAMSNLVNKGYITRVKGRGSFVSKPKITQEYTKYIESYNVEMQKKGLVPKTIVIEFKVIKADAWVADKLKIAQKEKVIYLKRLRYALGAFDEKPVLLTSVYIPFKTIPNLMDYDFESFSLYEALELNHQLPQKVVRELNASIAPKEISALLEIGENSPVQFITSTGFLSNGEIIEYSESYYPSARNRFVIEIIK
ncbi:MAG: GntR family transcriptional regulator [Oscillospiraceae bacterium]